MTTSPEQLSISLMAEARRLYNMNPDLPLGTTGLQTGDRLAMWATEAREIGVKHFRQREQWHGEWQGAQAKLARVVRLCKNNTGLQLAREILEALND